MHNRPQARLAGNAPVLRWLVDPGRAVPAGARPFLLAELLGTQKAPIMGALNGLLVETIALYHSGAPIFALLGGIELLLLSLRIRCIRDLKRQRAAGAVPAINRSVMLSILWCGLQGLIAFVVMTRGDAVLMIVSATMVLGITMPICARNFAAPRLALLLVSLCFAPYLLGAALSGHLLLLLMLPMFVPLFLGIDFTLRSFNRVLIATLAAEERNHFLARHDPLTGLLNRFGLDDALETLPLVDGTAMAVLCIDLDGFKAVNDRLGHAAGDRLLVGVAERLRAATGPDDIVARLGGDEFMVVVRHRMPDAIDRFATLLIDRIARTPYAVADDRSARVGASIGYACFPEDAATGAELRTRADAALYAAKEGGKGNGRRYAPPPGTPHGPLSSAA